MPSIRGMDSYFRHQALGANKRIRTRGVLLDSAVEVFADKGFEEARVSDIAALAGLANGTFYNHFKDKDELAAATAGAIALEIARRLDTRMHDLDAGLSRVVVASVAFLRLAATYAPWGSVLLEQFQRRPDAASEALEYMRSDILLAVEQGGLEVTVDRLLLEQLGAMMMVALRNQLLSGDDPQVLRRTCESVLRVLGLSPKRARREIERVSDHPFLSEALDFSNLLAD